MSHKNPKGAKPMTKQEREDAELAAFMEARSAKRKNVLKLVVVIALCLLLVVAFCLPAITMLI